MGSDEAFILFSGHGDSVSNDKDSNSEYWPGGVQMHDKGVCKICDEERERRRAETSHVDVKTDEKPVGFVDQTLSQRGKRYGRFEDQAAISQDLEDRLRASPNWSRLQADQKEALKIIVHKIARILNGDPDYDDSWCDIAGYATLVMNRLTNKGPR